MEWIFFPNFTVEVHKVGKNYSNAQRIIEKSDFISILYFGNIASTLHIVCHLQVIIAHCNAKHRNRKKQRQQLTLRQYVVLKVANEAIVSINVLKRGKKMSRNR